MKSKQIIARWMRGFADRIDPPGRVDIHELYQAVADWIARPLFAVNPPASTGPVLSPRPQGR